MKINPITPIAVELNPTAPERADFPKANIRFIEKVKKLGVKQV